MVRAMEQMQLTNVAAAQAPEAIQEPLGIHTDVWLSGWQHHVSRMAYLQQHHVFQ